MSDIHSINIIIIIIIIIIIVRGGGVALIIEPAYSMRVTII